MPELNSYSQRRQWSDSHLQQVKKALGLKFIIESNFEIDVNHGVDLVVPKLHFAVRLRQTKYSNYKDFTLRSSGGGERSEYAKLLDQTIAPDFLFYGYALDKNTLMAGYLIDLPAWRASLILCEMKSVFRRNRDGSHFVAFPFLPSYSEQII